MVIDTVREPYPFQVYFQGLKVWGVVRNPHVCIYSLQHLPDAQIVTSKLIEGDITTIERSL